MSSFGVGGTNVHLVIEAPARPDADRETQLVLDAPVPLLLSTSTSAELRLFADRLADHLERHRPPLPAVSFTLLTGRRIRACTHVVLAGSLADAVRQLRALGADPSPATDHPVPPLPAGSVGTQRVPLPAQPFSRVHIPGPAAVLQPAGGVHR